MDLSHCTVKQNIKCCIPIYYILCFIRTHPFTKKNGHFIFFFVLVVCTLYTDIFLLLTAYNFRNVELQIS